MITPRVLSGFMELLPEDQIIFDSLKNSIEKIFKLNGFLSIDTPNIELSEILLAKAGGELDKELYRFKKGDTDICLRYDLTVPFARYCSEHFNDLRFPFKRYQIGKSYRGERAQRGRYREFYQCDADIVTNGNLPIEADAESVYLITKTFEAIKLNDYTIKLSNRKILTGLIEYLGYKDSTSEILRILDKLAKIGKDGVKKELSQLNITLNEEIFSILETKGTTREKINLLKKFDNELLKIGLEELERVIEVFCLMGGDLDKIYFDISLVRGQDYYTGTIFETILNNYPELGSICGGGRYDNLTKFFSKERMSGVGMSIGLTRLFYILKTYNLLEEYACHIKSIIIPFDGFTNDAFSLAKELRNNEISCDVFYDDRSFKNKLKDAGRRNIKYVVLIGEDEVKTKQFTIKDMQTGMQEKLPTSELIKKLKEE